MQQIIDTAVEVQAKTGSPVLILNQQTLIILTSFTLYDPANMVYFNTFKGKVVHDSYIKGENWREISAVVDNLDLKTIILPYNHGNFTLIS